MPTVITRIGPEDHGQRLSLRDFDRAEAREGHLYELSRGIITVSDIPGLVHMLVVLAVRNQLVAFQLRSPQSIFAIASGSEAKMLLWDWESERHPDILVYTTPPPASDTWSKWVPALVVEVVSRGSKKRDYLEKREEYLSFGVKEYWIVDPLEKRITVLVRSRGKWKERVLGAGDTVSTTLLPGFALDVDKVFAAAAEQN